MARNFVDTFNPITEGMIENEAKQQKREIVVFVGNITSKDVTYSAISDLFSAGGFEVKQVDIKMKFAFVSLLVGEFDDTDSSAREELSQSLSRLPRTIGDTQVTIELSKTFDKKQLVEKERKTQQKPARNIFLVGYDVRKVREAQIRELMGTVGRVDFVQIPEGKSFAFVTFESINVATQAIDSFDGKYLLEGMLTLQYSLSVPLPTVEFGYGGGAGGMGIGMGMGMGIGNGGGAPYDPRVLRRAGRDDGRLARDDRGYLEAARGGGGRDIRDRDDRGAPARGYLADGVDDRDRGRVRGYDDMDDRDRLRGRGFDDTDDRGRGRGYERLCADRQSYEYGYEYTSHDPRCMHMARPMDHAPAYSSHHEALANSSAKQQQQYHHHHHQQQQQQDQQQQQIVFVGNLGSDVIRDQIRQLFENEHYRVIDVNMKPGYAFVTLDLSCGTAALLSREALVNQLAQLRCEMGSDRKLISIDLAKQSVDKRVIEQKRLETLSPTNRIFVVGYNAKNTTKEMIRTEMMRAGNIIDIYMPEGKKFAFVTFETVRDATFAIQTFHASNLFNGMLTLQYSAVQEKMSGSHAGGGGGGSGCGGSGGGSSSSSSSGGGGGGGGDRRARSRSRDRDGARTRFAPRGDSRERDFLPRAVPYQTNYPPRDTLPSHDGRLRGRGYSRSLSPV